MPTLFRPQIEYLQIKAKEEETQNLISAFVPAIKFIEEAINIGRVLVHCQDGVSRGATIVLAYLIWKKGWSLSTAFKYVKQRRYIMPNASFIH